MSQKPFYTIGLLKTNSQRKAADVLRMIGDLSSKFESIF